MKSPDQKQMTNPPQGQSQLSGADYVEPSKGAKGKKTEKVRFLHDTKVEGIGIVRAGTELDLPQEEVAQYCDEKFLPGPYTFSGEGPEKGRKLRVRRAIRMSDVQAIERLNREAEAS